MDNPFLELEKKFNQRFDAIEGILKAEAKPKRDRTGGIELAMEVTGLKRQCLYKLVQRRLIPCSKPSGTKLLIFRESELFRWIDEGRMSMESEIEDNAFQELRKL